jgi:hypothetical protein
VKSHKQFAGTSKKIGFNAKFSAVHIFVPGQVRTFSERPFFLNLVVLPALLFVYAATGSPVII